MRVRSVILVTVSVLAVASGRARADRADDVVAAVAAGAAGAGGSDSQVAAVAPEQLVPAVYRAIDALPPRTSDWRRTGADAVRLMRVERILLQLETRARKTELDRIYVAAWPVATKEHTKADLLYKFGERRIREAEPIVLAVFNDQSAAKTLRDTAAASLVAIDWPKHRDAVLSALAADDAFSPLAVELILHQKKELDPLVVTIAARRVEARAAEPRGDAATRAGLLAQMLGRYTGDANGVTRVMRAELPNPDNIDQLAGLELRSFRVWWAANRDRFEPTAKEEIERLKLDAKPAAAGATAK